MTTRSKRLHVSNTALTANVTTVLYTVPAGHVTILRSVMLYNPGSVTANIDERLNNPSSNFTLRTVTLGAAGADRLEFWRVLKAGDGYALRPNVNVTLNIWLSGAELVL